MHAKYMEFCMSMWQKGVEYEACLECGYPTFTPVAEEGDPRSRVYLVGAYPLNDMRDRDDNYFYNTQLYVKEAGGGRMAPAEVLAAISSALLDIGMDLADVRCLLRAKSNRARQIENRQWGKSESECEPLPEVSEQELRTGDWYPTQCVLISDLREAVMKYFPDDESTA